MLLTGIHLMKTGEVEAILLRLNEQYRPPYISELVARKLSGPEQSALPDADLQFHRGEYERLRGELQEAFEASRLPESSSAQPGLNDLLIRIRMGVSS
ncbi:MAG TPA: nucleotidyltransferase domain-containing protein [Tepidisphaeraceae bacterium]